MNKPVSPTGRKEQTKEKLVSSVGKVLAREGFKGLGVNKVAREAGVDKVLVYRYFDGLPNLVLEYSNTCDFWPTAKELLGADPERIKALSPDSQVAEFFKSFVAALRKRPVTLDILAWEVLERNELTKQLEDIRIRTVLEYFEYLEDIPDDENLTAIVAIMSGAVTHLLIKSRITDNVGGINIEKEDGWGRINRAIELLLKGIFE